MAWLKSDKGMIEAVRERRTNVEEALITIETVKYLREQVTACYRKEQTNHLEYCKPQVGAYLAALKEVKAAGHDKNIGF